MLDVGLLKIDISGELEIFAELQRLRFPLGQKVGILTIEQPSRCTRTTRKRMAAPPTAAIDLKELFNYLADQGCDVVAYEPQGGQGCCTCADEHSLVNISWVCTAPSMVNENATVRHVEAARPDKMVELAVKRKRTRPRPVHRH